MGAGNLPQTVRRLEAVPHGWLFPKVSAVVHHGGAGTTATELRHGIPSVVVPFFADQPFWGRRVNHLGAGPAPIPFARLSVDNLTHAIDQALNDPAIHRHAAILGEKLQREDGVGRAVGFIQAYLKNK